MNFRQINTNNSGGALYIPVRRDNGETARALDKDGVYRAMMIKPEIHALIQRPLNASLHDNPKKAIEIWKAAKEKGHAKLSDLPYDAKQERQVVGLNHNFNIQAANTIQPYDTDWQVLDRTIHQVDRSTDDNERMFVESLGLVQNDLQWSDWQIKQILRQQLQKRNNGKYAFTDLVPQAEKDPFGRIRYGEKTTEIPINYNTMITGTRAGSMVTDQTTASDAAISTRLQRNHDLLRGAGGASLTAPGTYWKGLLNHDQTVTFDNTLGGLYPGGVTLDNATDVERVMKFVKRQFVDSNKYGNFAAMLGFDIVVELATTIDDDKTDAMTLKTVMSNIGRDLNGAEFTTGVSHKIPTNAALFIVTNPTSLRIRSGGGLSVFELQSNGLGRESFVYSIDTLVAPGDGVTGNISIIYITDLLP
jgi:hypothetical protein